MQQSLILVLLSTSKNYKLTGGICRLRRLYVKHCNLSTQYCFFLNIAAIRHRVRESLWIKLTHQYIGRYSIFKRIWFSFVEINGKTAIDFNEFWNQTLYSWPLNSLGRGVGGGGEKQTASVKDDQGLDPQRYLGT